MNLLLLCLCATLCLALPIQFILTGDTPTIRLGSNSPSETIKPKPVVTAEEQEFSPKPTFREYVERLRLGRPSSAKGPSPDAKWPAESESESQNQEDEASFFGRKYGVLLSSSSQSNTGEHEQQRQASSSSPSRQYGVFLDKVNKFVELHGPKYQSVASNPSSNLHSEPDSSLGRLYGTFLGGMDTLMPSENHPKNALAKSRLCKNGSCNSSKPIASYLNLSELLDLLDTHGPECVAVAIFVLFPLAYLVLELFERILKRCTHEKYPERGRDRVRLVGPERQLRAWSNRQREIVLEEKQWWSPRQIRSR
ncbi:hypothetical protein N7509_005188 [Penicillium cosmopolitanum]|uniref:Uncharacterized protein n=1 Tax=Penicillium cosmopolitanum TaxID=1131564 RepID=A0A9W9W1V7_9EURO|nr:uncharacterized protein N7509_005188 [Penicillium cosmopolitanum]KAJ5397075.1 hypothetical protein N7509_005188 [Penicillium cosmopolitanum]